MFFDLLWIFFLQYNQLYAIPIIFLVLWSKIYTKLKRKPIVLLIIESVFSIAIGFLFRIFFSYLVLGHNIKMSELLIATFFCACFLRPFIYIVFNSIAKKKREKSSHKCKCYRALLLLTRHLERMEQFYDENSDIGIPVNSEKYSILTRSPLIHSKK